MPAAPLETLRGARAFLAVIAAAAATALAAQVSVPVPGAPVPQSLQTLAVAAAGGILGARRGAWAMALYVALGAAGLPVFADGASGAARLWGPTGGYLVGFVAGAWTAGWWMRTRWARGLRAIASGMALAHLVILAVGWAGLVRFLGVGDAFLQGVGPFLWGAVVKSVGAALLVALAFRGVKGYLHSAIFQERPEVAMERVVHKASSHEQARRWDVEQNVSMTPEQRMRAARELRDRAFPPDAKDVRACHRSE